MEARPHTLEACEKRAELKTEERRERLSRRFLSSLGGRKGGMLSSWLEAFDGEPRIAWYPSAGYDFRDLLYLHPGFAGMRPASKKEPAPPDIFLHTDFAGWDETTLLDTGVVHSDRHTTVSIKAIEELPRCDLPLDDEIVSVPQGGSATGRVLLMEVKVESDLLGSFTRPVIYAFSENAAFCAERILPCEARLSHVIHVRYGGGCGGGGRSSGVWLQHIIERLQCEVFITDGSYGWQPGDERVCMLYPELDGRGEDGPLLEEVRRVRGEEWSHHGDVTWNLVLRNRDLW